MDQALNIQGQTDRRKTVNITFPKGMQYEYAIDILEKNINPNDIFGVRPTTDRNLTVVLKTIEAAEKISDKGLEFIDGNIEVRPLSRTTKFLTITNIPMELSKECVVSIFEKYGTIVYYEMEKDKKKGWYTGTRKMRIRPKKGVEIPNIVLVGVYKAYVHYGGVKPQCHRCLSKEHSTYECDIPYCGICKSLGHHYKNCDKKRMTQTEEEEIEDINEEFTDEVKQIQRQKEDELCLLNIRQKTSEEKEKEKNHLNNFEDLFSTIAKKGNIENKQQNRPVSVWDVPTSPYRSPSQSPKLQLSVELDDTSICSIQDESSCSMDSILKEAIISATKSDAEKSESDESPPCKKVLNFKNIQTRSDSPKSNFDFKQALMATNKKGSPKKDCVNKTNKSASDSATIIKDTDLPKVITNAEKTTKKKGQKKSASVVVERNLFSDNKAEDFSPKKTRNFVSTAHTPRKKNINLQAL